MWIKNILGFLNKPSDKPDAHAIRNETSKPKIQTVDLFGSEPWLKAPAELAIKELHIPWACSQETIDEAKAVALQAIFAGTVTKDYSRTLSPSVFKTKREAHHAMAKIFICGNSAVDRFRAMSIGLKKFTWDFIDPQLCDFPEHRSYDKKVFTYKNGAKGDWPGKHYGCRCSASPVFED